MSGKTPEMNSVVFQIGSESVYQHFAVDAESPTTQSEEPSEPPQEVTAVVNEAEEEGEGDWHEMLMMKSDAPAFPFDFLVMMV